MSQDSLAECIRACNACADACDHCSVSCLEEDHVEHMVPCIRLDMDCAAVCRFTAGVLARNSKHSKLACRTCAEICDACAEECEKHDHEHCQQCAKACRDCAAACRAMVA